MYSLYSPFADSKAVYKCTSSVCTTQSQTKLKISVQFLVLRSVGTLHYGTWVIVISPDVSSIWWGRIRLFESWKWESKTSVSSVVTSTKSIYVNSYHGLCFRSIHQMNKLLSLPPFRQISWKLLLSMSQTHISKQFWLSILRFSANKQSLRCMQSSRACLLLFLPHTIDIQSVKLEVFDVW